MGAGNDNESHNSTHPGHNKLQTVPEKHTVAEVRASIRTTDIPWVGKRIINEKSEGDPAVMGAKLSAT